MAKSHKKHNSQKVLLSRKSLAIACAVLIAVIVFAAVYVSQNKVAATVGDKKIYQKSVDALYVAAKSSGSTLTKEQILQRMIDTKVLADYIEKKGFGLSDAEVKVLLEEEVTARGIDEEQFINTLAESGGTLIDYKESKEIEAYIRQQIDPSIGIGQDRISVFRQENLGTDLTDAEIYAILFKDVRQQLAQATIKLHKSSIEITYK